MRIPVRRRILILHRHSVLNSSWIIISSTEINTEVTAHNLSLKYDMMRLIRAMNTNVSNLGDARTITSAGFEYLKGIGWFLNLSLI